MSNSIPQIPRVKHSECQFDADTERLSTPTRDFFPTRPLPQKKRNPKIGLQPFYHKRKDCPAGCDDCQPTARHTKLYPEPIDCKRCKYEHGKLVRRCLSHTVLPFGEYKGRFFDEIPLAYLDWLASEEVFTLYGPLKTRLLKYLDSPALQPFINDLFAIEPIQTTPRPAHQKREPMPDPDKCFHPNTSDNDPFEPIRTKNAKQIWRQIANYMVRFELMTDPNDLLDLDLTHIRALCEVLPQTAEKLKDAYRKCRQRLQCTPAALTQQPTERQNVYRSNDRPLPTPKAHFPECVSCSSATPLYKDPYERTLKPFKRKSRYKRAKPAQPKAEPNYQPVIALCQCHAK